MVSACLLFWTKNMISKLIWLFLGVEA